MAVCDDGAAAAGVADEGDGQRDRGGLACSGCAASGADDEDAGDQCDRFGLARCGCAKWASGCEIQGDRSGAFGSNGQGERPVLWRCSDDTVGRWDRRVVAGGGADRSFRWGSVAAARAGTEPQPE